MTDDLKGVLSDGCVVPLGEVIAAIGRGVAEAQAALDRASIDATHSVYNTEGDAGTALLRDIGYRPTFYVLPETTCEVQISMRVGGNNAADGSANAPLGTPTMLRTRTYVTPVDASFANRFGYQAQASAKLSFKIVPVPPPTAFEDYRSVPQVIGLYGDKAADALEAAGFASTIVNDSGETTTADMNAIRRVNEQRPAALGLAALGSTVTLKLDHSAIVPQTYSFTGKAAAAALQKAGFVAAFVDNRGASVTAKVATNRKVIEQLPSALELAQIGTTVTLTLDGRLVPAVKSCSGAEAANILEKLRFQVAFVDIEGSAVPTDAAATHKVIKQDPDSQSLAAVDSIVTLTLEPAG